MWGVGGCSHSCRQDDDPVLGNKISQVSLRRGGAGVVEGEGGQRPRLRGGGTDFTKRYVFKSKQELEGTGTTL